MKALVKWLDDERIKQSDLARTLGVTRQAVQGWHSGNIQPGLYYAMALEVVSGGKVKQTDWLTQAQRLALGGLARIGEGAQRVKQ